MFRFLTSIQTSDVYYERIPLKFCDDFSFFTNLMTKISSSTSHLDKALKSLTLPLPYSEENFLSLHTYTEPYKFINEKEKWIKCFRTVHNVSYHESGSLLPTVVALKELLI